MVPEPEVGRLRVVALKAYHHRGVRAKARAGIELVPVDAAQARVACRAYSRFGKGRHRAGLNFGDLFAYALASARREALLCKGDDSRHTDLDVEP